MENWINELNYKKHFSDEYNEIVELIGFENFIRLFSRFKKSNVYFSETPILNLKREYISIHKKDLIEKTVPVKKVARLLGVSERFIHNTLNEFKQLNI